MSGKNEGYTPSFSQLFNKQIEFQKQITKLELPQDNVEWFSYHIQGMVEELGEVLRADKRWKTHRNNLLDLENKKEELMDVLITTFNLLIFAGMNSEDVLKELQNKIGENFKKLEGERGENKI